jgi:hypothetical protein
VICPILDSSGVKHPVSQVWGDVIQPRTWGYLDFFSYELLTFDARRESALPLYRGISTDPHAGARSILRWCRGSRSGPAGRRAVESRTSVCLRAPQEDDSIHGRCSSTSAIDKWDPDVGGDRLSSSSSEQTSKHAAAWRLACGKAARPHAESLTRG